MANPKIHLHCYLDLIEARVTPDQWFDYVGGYTDDKDRRWAEAGVDLEFQTSRTGGLLDFQNSLRDPGSVVIYLGHGVLNFANRYSTGLSPRDLGWAEIGDMDRWKNGDWKKSGMGKRRRSLWT